eukprot:TRINITY_DN5287_c0_g1_i2.p1 TRINITY_DN5287_c0_g1~~TRINITY_DN5287_c0_g1_i2.p1  ORF type:complete len:255 (-),score=50.48 TRINITY_DN5287_c0_g1_i2:102-830(-)
MGLLDVAAEHRWAVMPWLTTAAIAVLFLVVSVVTVIVCCIRMRRNRRDALFAAVPSELDDLAVYGSVADATASYTGQVRAVAEAFVQEHPTYYLEGPFIGIGRRSDKHFFSLTSYDGIPFVLSLAPCLGSPMPGAAVDLFNSICRKFVEHPNISCPLTCAYVPPPHECVAAVCAWRRKGSLRDRLHVGANPARTAHEKYTARAARPLSAKQIAHFGRQILEVQILSYTNLSSFSKHVKDPFV